MPVLAQGELSSMRADLDATLPGTAVIYNPAKAKDGQGGQVWTYAAAGTVAARLSPSIRPVRPGEEAGRMVEHLPYVLTLPAETQITVQSRVSYGGTTYEVTEVAQRTPWEISRRCRLAEKA